MGDEQSKCFLSINEIPKIKPNECAMFCRVYGVYVYDQSSSFKRNFINETTKPD